MKRVAVSDLRQNFSSIMAWIERGETVEISKRGRIVALLSPAPGDTTSRFQKRPNFLDRFKRRYGTLRLPGNSVLDERKSRSY